MNCACYIHGDAALNLNPCPEHERWAKAIRAVTRHDVREVCAGRIEAAADLWIKDDPKAAQRLMEV